METSDNNSSKKRDPRNDIAAGIFLAAWGVVGWSVAAGTPALWSDEYGADPGPGLLPAIVLTILSMGSLILFLGGIRRLLIERVPPGYWRGLWRHALIPTLLVATLLIYFPAIKIVGFIPASAVFAFGWMVTIGFKNYEGRAKALLLQAAAGTIIGVGLIYFVFVRLIGVPLL